MKKPLALFIFALLYLSSINIINAQTWTPVGTPIAGTDNMIYALEVYDNKLFAGGYNISTAGTIQANTIAAWDGSNWINPFGNTILSWSLVSGMCVYDNKLVVAGGLYFVGGLSSGHNMAEWDGTNWATPFGNIGTINDMIVFNSELYIAHQIAPSNGCQVKKWNGTSWSNVGVAIGGNINDLEIYNGELYMTGTFSTPVNKIAKWNGTSWVTIGLGLANTGNSMQSFNGKLYIAEQNKPIKSWNGVSISVEPSLINVPSTVKFGIYNNQLILGGYSSTVCYCQPSFYNGSSFVDIPISTATHIVMNESAFKVYNGELYASFLSGGVGYYNYIAKLNNPIGIKDLKEVSTELKIFPNPTQNILNVQIPSQNDDAIIELINSLGIIVYKMKESKQNLEINTSFLTSGIYTLRVTTIKGKLYSKFYKD